MSVKGTIHSSIGSFLCRIKLIYWNTRDVLFPPKEEAVLFVTHPDDDTLFFHTFIKDHRPYVCLMTAGFSVNRLSCFSRNMKHYGVKFRAYPMQTNDNREKLLYRHAKTVFRQGNYRLCVTHNSEGEYGHSMHARVHQAVVMAAKENSCPVKVPVSKENLSNFPLKPELAAEKKRILETVYESQAFVLDNWPDWIENEHLTALN